MRPVVLLVASTVLVAGCLGGSAPDPHLPENNTTEIPDRGDVIRYAANRTRLPDPVHDVTTWYNLTGFGGAEPTMGITDSGALFAQASDDMIRSTDDGATWTSIYHVGLEGDEDQPTDLYGSWDPLMWVDPVTDLVYNDPMFPPLLCTELSWSDDDGDTWTTNPATCHPPPMDHQKLFSGPPGPEAPPAAGLAHETVLYQCYNQVFDTACATSYDGGITWANVQPVADEQRHDCGGINGFGDGGPDGVAAVPIASGCDRLHIALTLDSGITWDVVEAPAGPGAELFDPEIDFDANGTMYSVWRGDDHGTYLTATPDRGESWRGPWELTPPGVQSTMYPTFNVGADGRAAVAFLGSPNNAQGPQDAPEDALWYLYVVTIDDVTADDPTFTSYQVTPSSDPVQVGRICTGGFGGCPDGKRNLLEFIDSAIHPDGTFYVIYTEGCVRACVEDPRSGASMSSEISVAALQGWPIERPDF